MQWTPEASTMLDTRGRTDVDTPRANCHSNAYSSSHCSELWRKLRNFIIPALMKKLLFVKCSPRGEVSKTTQIARAFLDEYRATHPHAHIEEMDIFNAALPEYAAEGATAKMSHFGEGEMAGPVKDAWERIQQIFAHFNSFDDYLFSIPMWNFGVPYKLKQYIDILSQPGLLFGFDPAAGYLGMLRNKRATAIYSSAIYFDGATPAFGTDHAQSHFSDWLRFSGISDAQHIFYQKYKMVSPEEAEAILNLCKEAARRSAAR